MFIPFPLVGPACHAVTKTQELIFSLAQWFSDVNDHRITWDPGLKCRLLEPLEVWVQMQRRAWKICFLWASEDPNAFWCRWPEITTLNTGLGERLEDAVHLHMAPPWAPPGLWVPPSWQSATALATGMPVTAVALDLWDVAKWKGFQICRLKGWLKSYISE